MSGATESGQGGCRVHKEGVIIIFETSNHYADVTTV